MATTTTQATFNYLPRTHPPPSSFPHLYHLPPLSSFTPVSLPITNIKSSLSPPLSPKNPFSLTKQGFLPLKSPSVMFSPPYNNPESHSWNNPDIVKDVYVKEVEELVLKVTGGRRVWTDQVIVRNCVWGEVDGLARSQDPTNTSTSTSKNQHNDDEKEEGKEGNEDEEFPKLIGVKQGTGASPAPKVHLDLSPLGARTHLRNYHPKTTLSAQEILTAEEKVMQEYKIPLSEIGRSGLYEGPRWAMFSIWRPLKTVRRDPLVVGDCSTFPKNDYVEFDVLFPSIGKGKGEGKGEGETHMEQAYLAYAPQERDGDGEERHDWYWIKEMEVDEVFVIQLFDSEAEREGRGMGGGVMHACVGLEDGDEEEEPRESCEVRCCVVW